MKNKYYITLYTAHGVPRADIRTNPKHLFMDIPAADLDALKKQIMQEQPGAVFIDA